MTIRLASFATINWIGNFNLFNNCITRRCWGASICCKLGCSYYKGIEISFNKKKKGTQNFGNIYIRKSVMLYFAVSKALPLVGNWLFGMAAFSY